MTRDGTAPSSITPTPAIARTPVTFQSGSDLCAGDLYLPAEAVARVPVVVMAHGFSGTKDLALPTFATAFAEAGMAVLAFDYRGWGLSSGRARQVVDIASQQADYRAAVAFARSHPAIDPNRVALWGTSLSGGHVIAVAAADRSIAAVVAQVPWVGLELSRESPRPTSVTLRLMAAGVVDIAARALGLPPYLVPVMGRDHSLAAFPSTELMQLWDSLAGNSDTWRNEYAARSLFALLGYSPGKLATRVSAPLLVCVAERDEWSSTKLAEAAAGAAPMGELRRYPITHFEAYLGASPTLLQDEVQFLLRYLS